MKKMMFFAFAAVLAVLVCSCRTQIVAVDVQPADARVIANGVEYNNKSPFFIEANTAKQLLITAYKEGYREKIYAVDYSLSTLGVVEAWTSIFIFPAIGLLFDNAWELNENNITITLEPVSPAAKAEAATFAPRTVPMGRNGFMDEVEKKTSSEAQKTFNEL